MAWTKEQAAERSRAWRKANPEKAAEYSGAWRKANPERRAECARAWKKSNPEKALAHKIARNARRSGVLVATTCEKCGESKVEMHHPDYTKPLAVQWLCKRCHTDLHMKQRISE
jgi:ribosomal protein S27AE